MIFTHTHTYVRDCWRSFWVVAAVTKLKLLISIVHTVPGYFSSFFRILFHYSSCSMINDCFGDFEANVKERKWRFDYWKSNSKPNLFISMVQNHISMSSWYGKSEWTMKRIEKFWSQHTQTQTQILYTNTKVCKSLNPLRHRNYHKRAIQLAMKSESLCGFMSIKIVNFLTKFVHIHRRLWCWSHAKSFAFLWFSL